MLIETYRGCKIYYLEEWAEYTDWLWNTPCIPGGQYTSKQDTRKAIDDKLEAEEPEVPEATFLCPYCAGAFYFDRDRTRHIELAHPPAPPTPPEDTEIETYRTYKIYRRPYEGMFYANVTSTITAIGLTLVACRASIDKFLKSLEPEEDPAAGLFAQVVAAMKTWVNNVIGDRLQPVYTWVDNLFANAEDAWEGLVAGVNTSIAGVSASLGNLRTESRNKWSTFTTQTLPNIWGMINHNAAAAMAAIDLKGTELTSALSEGLADNRAWVKAFFKLMDPMEFLRDPVGFIKAVFTVQRQIAGTSMAGSFLEGLEEGLEE